MGASPEIAIVYQARNLVNGHRYIGFTTQGLERREKQHRKAAQSERQRKFRFHRALSKYGDENFVFELLGDFDGDIELAKLYEVEAIAKYKPEYNILIGGGGGPMPDELRQKLSASRIGKRHSEETRKKLSEAAFKRPPRLGVRPTAEVRARMSAAQKAVHARGISEKHAEALRKNGKNWSQSSRKQVLCETDGRLHVSVREAAKFYGLNDGTVSRVLTGKIPSVFGLVFSYFETDE